eukprot:TRINITY_DN11297_c1_g1_i1.p1 TRINITY_DN11297_c1_g1~~TRINITY_DN11297_c1_g1_i1.p1  ORF type:complete len:422 (+),score=155.88 TRINITY_DN11297_c1_g1_i1:60-1268(+)
MADKQTQDMQGSGGHGACAKGAVQKAMGQNVAVDSVWEEVRRLETVEAEFGDVLSGLSASEEKLVAARTMIPLVRQKLNSDPAAVARKRAGILNGYRDAAERNGITWRREMADLESRGMPVWEQERAAMTDQWLTVPDYYVYGGQGPLHSYAEGNCNWEAAFDCKPAFELVHMHHFPELPPADCMAELHRRLDDAAIGALQGPPRVVVDVGCGVGTSTFSLRRSLDRHGFRDAKVLACDLSTHFVTVADYRRLKGDQSAHKWTAEQLRFKHGDGMQLSRLGVADGTADIVMHAKLSHEAPTHVNYMLAKEAAKKLRPGGVVAYVDINASQILKNNPVSNIAQRVAISNEPFFDQFLGLDVHDMYRSAGLEIVAEQASNPDKWPVLEDAPVRVLVARKPVDAP